jgi:hypothetical protein
MNTLWLLVLGVVAVGVVLVLARRRDGRPAKSEETATSAKQ